MRKQPTLTELKCFGAEAFAKAQDAIHTAYQIACDCRELNAELGRARDELNESNRESRRQFFAGNLSRP